MTDTIKPNAPSHLILTLDQDKKMIAPAAFCLFKENAAGCYVYFNDKSIAVKETIDEIMAMLNAPYLAAKADYEQFLQQPVM